MREKGRVAERAKTMNRLTNVLLPSVLSPITDNRSWWETWVKSLIIHVAAIYTNIVYWESMTSPSRTGTPQDAPELVAIEESDGVALGLSTDAEDEDEDEVPGSVEVESPGETSILSSLGVLDGASSVDGVVDVCV